MEVNNIQSSHDVRIGDIEYLNNPRRKVPQQTSRVTFQTRVAAILGKNLHDLHLRLMNFPISVAPPANATRYANPSMVPRKNPCEHKAVKGTLIDICHAVHQISPFSSELTWYRGCLWIAHHKFT